MSDPSPREVANQIMAQRLERELDKLAGRAHLNREIDDRWREVAARMDHARTLLREMAKP